MSGQTNEDSLRYEGWPVVAACGVGAFFAIAPINTFAVFLKPICDHFAWSRESAASAYATLTLLAALSAPWAGTLLDRRGARRVIVTCLAISGCAVASLAFMTASLWHLRAVFAVIGLVTMGAGPLAYSRAIFGWFTARRGRALGLMLAGAALSSVVLPVVAQALIRTLGWRLAWFVLGLGTLGIAWPVAVRLIRDAPRRIGLQGQSSAIAGNAADVAAGVAMRSRAFWTLMVVVFGGTVASNAAVVHMVALLADRGVPTSRAAFAASAMGAASLLGRLLTGWLLDRFDAARVSTVLLLCSAAGTFLLSGANSLAMGSVAAMCIGFGSGGEMDVTPYLLVRHFGMRSLSTLYGFNWTAWGLAGAAGPILMGRAFDATGSYAVALVELGSVTLVAALLMATFPVASPAPDDVVLRT